MKVALSSREMKSSINLTMKIVKTAGITIPAEEAEKLCGANLEELAKLMNENAEPGVRVDVVVIDGEAHLVIEHSEKMILAVFETLNKHYDRIVPVVISIVNLGKSLKFIVQDFMADVNQAVGKALAE